MSVFAFCQLVLTLDLCSTVVTLGHMLTPFGVAVAIEAMVTVRFRVS